MAIKTSKSQEMYFTTYKTSNKQAKNRKRKLERQLVIQPGNREQIEKALKDINYRRGTPKAPFWSHQMIATAKLFKEFLGKFDKQFFSADPKVSTASVTQNTNVFEKYAEQVAKNLKTKPLPKYSMFSIQARFNDKAGAP